MSSSNQNKHAKFSDKRYIQHITVVSLLRQATNYIQFSFNFPILATYIFPLVNTSSGIFSHVLVFAKNI